MMKIRIPILCILYIVFLSCASTCPVVKEDLSKSNDEIQKGNATAEPEKDPKQIAYAKFLLSSFYINKGEYKKAEQYLNDALRSDPDSAYLNTKMALLLKEMGRLDEAELYAKRSMELDSQNLNSLLVLAEILRRKGQEKRAFEVYEKAIKLDPQNRNLRILLCNYYLRKREFKKALNHAKNLLDIAPQLPITHYYWGRIQFHMGNYKKAEEGYKKAIELKEDMVPALFDLGTLYQVKGMYKKAIDVYERFIRRFPSNIEVRKRLVNLYMSINKRQDAERHLKEMEKKIKEGDKKGSELALLYIRYGRIDRGIKILKAILNRWPKYNKALYYLGLAYEEKDEYEKALNNLKKIGKDSPLYEDSRIHMVYVLSRLKRFDEAIEIIENAKRYKKSRDFDIMLAEIYEEKKDYQKSLEILNGLLKDNSQDVELIYRIGIVYDKMGKKEESIRTMEKILSIDPDHADALNYIGYTYAEMGIRLDEALKLIEKALKIKPNSGYIVDSLGWVYFKKGQYDRALELIKKALSLTPNDPTIIEHLGDIYIKRRRYKKALELYQRAIELNHPDKEKIRDKIRRIKEFIK